MTTTSTPQTNNKMTNSLEEAEEDTLLTPTTTTNLHHPSSDLDSDSDSETPDYLSLPLPFHTTSSSKLPKRGEKDSGPNRTTHQTTLLAHSRHAMHEALSVPRTHAPNHKTQVIGYWHQDRRQCWIPRPRGTHFKTLGRVDADGEMWLEKEEMLFLCERGGLDVRYLNWFGDGGDDDGGLTMGLQGAYAVVFGNVDGVGGREGLDLEEWVVYQGLKRIGFVVLRVGREEEREGREIGQRDGDGDGEGSRGFVGATATNAAARLFRWLFGGLFFFGRRRPRRKEGGLMMTTRNDDDEMMMMGPLVRPGLYRSYNDIYNLLSLIPYHDPRTPPPITTSTSTCTSNPYKLTYKIYKPSRLPSFKKSSPGKPDYFISVINARELPLPSLSQLSSLLATVPDDPPPASPPQQQQHQGQMYRRLKHGWRNVILAVVDQGVVSYLRVSEAGFGIEGELRGKRVTGRGGGGMKGGGGRGGRGGRGRGRGRGGGR